MSLSGPYAAREERASQLLTRRDHARELLSFYREILARQEPLYRKMLRGPGAAAPPRLDLAGLDLAALDRPFRRFVTELGKTANEPLAASAKALDGADEQPRRELLQRTAELGSLASLATSLDRPLPHLAFFGRAFLQPIAEALAARDAVDLEGTGPRLCPRCGWPPQVSAVRDEAEIRGRRRLICGLCATAWPFPRARCPACGETDPEKLALHESESLPHLRIEACRSCRTYIKSVDLRKDGAAVPVVDDIATVELDVWSEEQGLGKVSRNLLGL